MCSSDLNVLAEDVYVAAVLAKKDRENYSDEKLKKLKTKAVKLFNKLKEQTTAQGGRNSAETLATKVYAMFAQKGLSKPIAAQYLADLLEEKFPRGVGLRERLPQYLVAAIDYVTLTSETKGNEQEASDV